MADVKSTLAERGSRYGSFADNAKIAQDLKDVMRNTPGWVRLTPSMKEALEMDVHKTARILNGDPTYVDNWHDKQGYIRLVEQELIEGSPKSDPVEEVTSPAPLSFRVPPAAAPVVTPPIVEPTIAAPAVPAAPVVPPVTDAVPVAPKPSVPSAPPPSRKE